MDVFEELDEPVAIPVAQLAKDDKRDIAFALFETMNSPRGYITMTPSETARYEKLAERLQLNLNHEGIHLLRWAVQRDKTAEEITADEEWEQENT